MRLRESIVERDGAREGLNGLLRVSVPVVGQCELVEDARRTVVKEDKCLVVLRRARVSSHCSVDVTKQLDRPRRRRIERRGFPQIPKRRSQLAAAPVGVAPLQVGEHRVTLQDQGAAEGLDRPVCLILRQRDVARRDQVLKLALLAHGIPRQDNPDHQGGKTYGNDQQASHGRDHRKLPNPQSQIPILWRWPVRELDVGAWDFG